MSYRKVILEEKYTRVKYNWTRAGIPRRRFQINFQFRETAWCYDRSTGREGAGISGEGDRVAIVAAISRFLCQKLWRNASDKSKMLSFHFSRNIELLLFWSLTLIFVDSRKDHFSTLQEIITLMISCTLSFLEFKEITSWSGPKEVNTSRKDRVMHSTQSS